MKLPHGIFLQPFKVGVWNYRMHAVFLVLDPEVDGSAVDSEDNFANVDNSFRFLDDQHH